MSTSQQYSWNATTSDIINRALRIVGALPLGNNPSTAEYNNALRTINAINKKISVDGIKLWTLDEFTYTISTPSTVLGTDGSYQFCIKSHTSSADNYPISGASSTDYWKLGGDITTNVWSSGTAYSSNIEIALSGQYIGIDSAFWRDNATDYPLQIISKQEYNKIEDKYTRCTLPSHIAVENNLSNINLTIYPVPYIATGRLHVFAVRHLQDFVNTTDNPDFPVEWIEFLVYALAASLSDEYNRDLNERMYLMNKAKELYREAKGGDRSIISSPVVRGAYRI